jgi:hypothetical protein
MPWKTLWIDKAGKEQHAYSYVKHEDAEAYANIIRTQPSLLGYQEPRPATVRVALASYS